MEKYGIDIDVDDKSSHLKARVRLMAACEKTKKVLTTEGQANISMDSLADNKDFVSSIRREHFENLSRSLLERLIQTLDDALMDSDLTKSDIHSVELVGSGSRIPSISSLIGKFFGKAPNRTLNGSECVAHGCALQGVIFRSNNNRGYAYELQDSIPYSVGFTLRQQPNKSVQGKLEQSSSGADFKDTKKFIKNRQIEVSDRKSSSGADSKDSRKFIKNRQIEESDSRSESSSAKGAEGILDQFSELKCSVVLFQRCQQFPCVLYHNIPDSFQFFVLSSFYKYQSAFPPNASQRSRHFKVDVFQMERSLPCPVTLEISINLHGVVVIQSAKAQKQGYFGMKVFEEIKFYEISHIGMILESIYSAKDREKCLLLCDKQAEAVQCQKSALENFICDTRSKLKDSYRSFAKVVEKEKISQNLNIGESLINDDGDLDIVTYTTTLQGLKQIYSSCKEELLLAIQRLLWILPKDIEQLPMLVEKIKRITTMSNESNHLLKDVSTVREKCALLVRETINNKLSAHHKDKQEHRLHTTGESDMVEETRGQAVAGLLYAIFDSRVELVYLKSLHVAGNQESDNFIQIVINTCNAIENFCEEMKPQDIQPNDIKSMQKELDRFRQMIQQHIFTMETRVDWTIVSNINEAVTQEVDDETTDLQDYLLEIEKKLFGRYRYFLQSDEETSISKMIKYLRQQNDIRNHLQLKAQLHTMLDPIKKRYQEYKNERVLAVGEFYECIFEIRLTTLSFPNKEVFKRCDDVEKWLNRTFPKPRSRWMDLEIAPWSSEIRKRIENFKMECQTLMQNIRL